MQMIAIVEMLVYGRLAIVEYHTRRVVAEYHHARCDGWWFTRWIFYTIFREKVNRDDLRNTFRRRNVGEHRLIVFESRYAVSVAKNRIRFW